MLLHIGGVIATSIVWATTALISLMLTIARTFSVGIIEVCGGEFFKNKVDTSQAIRRSWELVKHNYWKVFASMILFFLSVMALRTSLESLVSLVTSILYLVLRLLGGRIPFMEFVLYISYQIQMPLFLLSMAVIAPIYTIMMTMLYFNQRIKNEGFDMRIRLREIQIDNERKQASEFTTFNGNFAK